MTFETVLDQTGQFLEHLESVELIHRGWSQPPITVFPFSASARLTTPPCRFTNPLNVFYFVNRYWAPEGIDPLGNVLDGPTKLVVFDDGTVSFGNSSHIDCRTFNTDISTFGHLSLYILQHSTLLPTHRT